MTIWSANEAHLKLFNGIADDYKKIKPDADERALVAFGAVQVIPGIRPYGAIACVYLSIFLANDPWQDHPAFLIAHIAFFRCLAP